MGRRSDDDRDQRPGDEVLGQTFLDRALTDDVADIAHRIFAILEIFAGATLDHSQFVHSKGLNRHGTIPRHPATPNRVAA